ncbi:hypothetical protein MBLNU230_g6005t1 [Neophaeotheca triangularis]
MASTVLGKRTRNANGNGNGNGNGNPLGSASASKKHALPIDNPFITRRSDESRSDEDINDFCPSAKRTRRSAPRGSAKHEQRVAPSPQNKTRIGNSDVEIYQDNNNNNEQHATFSSTPQTPRHRDALSKKVPITPRHRVLVGGLQFTPKTPRTPTTPSGTSTAVYNQARQLFSRCSAPGKLIGRLEEKQELSDFLERSFESDSAGCLYVSGPPGTGKSAFVQEICEGAKKRDSVDYSVVNCMSVKSGKDLGEKLSEDLNLKANAGLDYLRSCFVSGKKQAERKYLVILDEVDRLVDLDIALLYSLFEWSMQPNSRLVLIGIANALDLTDRFLPRLKSRGLKPELLPFMPYSAPQIAQVLSEKLRSLSSVESTNLPFLQPAAIQFCAKKVAAQTGDLRKAFDICRRAVDLAEQETRDKDAKLALQDGSPSKTPLMDNINLTSPVTPHSPSKGANSSTQPELPIPRPAYTVDTAPRATIAHMAKVTSQAFNNNAIHRLSTLNLQQKAVLCSLAALEKRKRDSQLSKTMFATPSKKPDTASPSVKQLFEAYTAICKREKLLAPLSGNEFRDVVSGLETQGLVQPADGRMGTFASPLTPSKTPGRRGKGGFAGAAVGDERRVASAVGRSELAGGLEGVGGELLREILEGDGLV